MKKELNVKLLRKIQRHILEEPRRLYMGTWKASVSEDISPCGTQACIAGWAMELSGKKIPLRDDYPEIAAELLGLEFSRSDYAIVTTDCEAGKLFLEKSWPNQFRSDFGDTEETLARKASDRIDYFIQHGE